MNLVALLGIFHDNEEVAQVVDACECGNEPSGSVKCGEFLDWLQTSKVLKKYSAPWSNEEVATAFCEWLPIQGLYFYLAFIFQVVPSCDKYSEDYVDK